MKLESKDIEVSFTGEGEAIHNLKHLNKVIDVLSENKKISSIKIAFSGVGVRLISKINTKIPITLQFSLHHANEDKRKNIIPFSDSLLEIKLALIKYECMFSKININYVLMDGINNSTEDLLLLNEFVNKTNWNILFNPLVAEGELKYINLENVLGHEKIKIYKKIGESIVNNDFYKKLTYSKIG